MHWRSFVTTQSQHMTQNMSIVLEYGAQAMHTVWVSFTVSESKPEFIQRRLPLSLQFEHWKHASSFALCPMNVLRSSMCSFRKWRSGNPNSAKRMRFHPILVFLVGSFVSPKFAKAPYIHCDCRVWRARYLYSTTLCHINPAWRFLCVSPSIYNIVVFLRCT